MKNYPFILSFAAIPFSVLFASGGKTVKRPNVLILLADQHNKKVMSFEQHPDVITPNLDKLAAQSVIFDRAYCVAGISAPSRSALMSGLYPRTMGLLSNGEKTTVIRDAVSLASIFKENGYATYAFGKRHTSGGIDEGWDVSRSHICRESPGEGYDVWIQEHGLNREFAMDWGAEFGRGPDCSGGDKIKVPTGDLGTRLSQLPPEYTMEAYTAKNTIEMIKSHARSKKPFFCWATFYHPHQPYTPQKKYLDMHNIKEWGDGTRRGSGIRKPESLYEDIKNLPPMMQRIRKGGNKVWNVNKAFEDEQLWRNYIGAYYALVSEVDSYVGKILDALEREGMSEETIVIYTADHGDFVGNHGMVEKCAAGQNVYEDILNIPLIIRYPGGKQGGRRVKELVSNVDLFPTILEMAGIRMPDVKYKPQGQSLYNVVCKGQTLNRKYVVSESWSQATVITPRYKLGIMLDPVIVKPNLDFRSFGDMFFISEKDSLEVSNEINNKEYAKVISQLRNYYREFQKKIPDTGKQEMINKKSY